MTGRKSTRLAATAAVATLVAAGCGSGAKSSTSNGGTAGGPTYTVGVLTDLTGPGSNTAGSFPVGVKAGIGVAAKAGYNIKYVVADTGTSPSGALTAAQRLVDQDHVFAVFMTSVVGFGAASYLTSKGIPVVGAAVDGPEWITSPNMFSVLGTQDYTKVESTWGDFWKQHGVTTLGSVGYSVEPSSAEVAKGYAASAQRVGIKVGYLNANFPLGSTNVTPIALAMKAAGVDGLGTGILTNSTFAIIDDLRQEGVNLKAALIPVGYGGDLAQGGPGAQQSAQGLYFLDGYEPIEMHTAATARLQSAMQTYAGVSGDPTFSEYQGYTTVDAFTKGLKAAGRQPTQASFIKAMLGITNYNAAGLYGSHSVSFAMKDRGLVSGADNCVWITRYSGTTFHLVTGEDPICGTTIPGLKVSAS